MINIQFPEPDFRIQKKEGKPCIFDPLRKRWLVLTPEEWVRQNFVQFLIKTRSYPATLIAMEKVIMLGELKKRFDILIYDSGHKPWMMVECKEMNVKLDEDVLQQVLRYNISVPVMFIIVTNGTHTHGWQKTVNGLVEIDTIPSWQP
jgi:hypothetical protein